MLLGVEVDFKFVKSTFESCGIVINKSKSSPFGSSNIEFLGIRVDTLSMTVSLKERKLREISSLCVQAVDYRSVLFRNLS